MACGKDNLRELSVLLSKLLCLSGIGSYTTELVRNKTLVFDHLYRNAYKEYELFGGGSVAEGTFTSGSDIDSMYVVPGISIKVSESKVKDLEKSGTVFYLDTSQSRHGYTRLRLLHLADKNNQMFEDNNVEISDVLEQTEEGMFASSEKFASLNLSIQNKNYPSEICYRNGPCATIQQTNNHGYIEGTQRDQIVTDMAFAIACQEWPVESKEWIDRKRLYNWPNASWIEKIRNKRCFVVPVGHPESQNQSLEWRISYALLERELLWSFTNTQLHCFYILKELLKLSLEKIAPDQLSSYHMKTLVLWLSEEHGLSMWKEEKLLECVKACLNRLYDCVNQRHLPHYFNSKANLFGHKLQDEVQREYILKKIKEITEEVTTYVLTCLPLEWDWPKTMLRNMSTKANRTHFEELEKDYKNNIKDFEVFYLSNIMYDIQVRVINQSFPTIYIARQLASFQDDPPECKPMFIEITTTFLELRFVMSYFREILLHGENVPQTSIGSMYKLTDHVTNILLYNKNMDAMSGKLYLATIHHFLGDYSESMETVKTLLNKTKHLVYCGASSANMSIELTGDGLIKQEPVMNVHRENRRTGAAIDIIFSYQDVHLVPYPLKFECALAEFDSQCKMIIIHPCVYANFLLSYGHYLSRDTPSFNETLKLLQMSVEKTRGGQNRHHALNILAFCHLLNGNIQAAFKALTESIQETNKLLNVLNAAGYYIAIILLNELMNKKEITSSTKVCQNI